MATVLQSSPPGQNHDRFVHTDELGLRDVLPPRQDGVDGSSGTIPDITPFQKMLSATTGSLLTGLTSMHRISHHLVPADTRLIADSDTARRRPSALAIPEPEPTASRSETHSRTTALRPQVCRDV